MKNNAAFLMKHDAAFLMKNDAALLVALQVNKNAACLMKNNAAFLINNNAAFLMKNNAAEVWQGKAQYMTDLSWATSMHQHPLLAHHFPSRPLPRNGQHCRIPRAWVWDQATFLEPLPGDQVQPVGIHVGQHIAAVAGQDYQLFMPCFWVFSHLKQPSYIII